MIWPQCVLGTPWFQVSSRICLVLRGIYPFPLALPPRSKRKLGQPLLSCECAKLRGRGKTKNWDSPLSHSHFNNNLQDREFCIRGERFPHANFEFSSSCCSCWFGALTNRKRSGYYGNLGSLRAGTRHHREFSVMGTPSLQPFLKSYWLTPVQMTGQLSQSMQI